MAASDAPATLSELRTAFLEGIKEITGNSTVNAVADRYLNLGLHDMHQERWWWAERRDVIETHAPYTTGTVSITAASSRTAVTGSSTLWNTTVSGMGFTNARVGGKVTFAGTTDVYLVSAVGSDTALTLANRYIGDDLSGATYRYFEDEYALASDFDAEHGVIDTKFFDEARQIELIPSRDFFARFPVNSTPGAPRCATLIELGPSGSVALRRRVVLAPPPDRLMTIPYRYYTTSLALSSAGAAQTSLSADTDQPIVPLRWRQGIVWKALALWAEQRLKNLELAAQHQKSYETLMQRARASHDLADDKPRLIPKVAGYMAHARRPYHRGSQRYSTNDAFDSLRD